MVPLRRRWPYAVAAAVLAVVIGGAGWIMAGRNSLTAEPLGPSTESPSVTSTPTPAPVDSALPTASPSEEATPTPSPTPTRTRTPSATPSTTRTPSPTPSPKPVIEPPTVTYVAGGFMFDGTWTISFRVCPGTRPEQLTNRDVTLRLESDGSVHSVVPGLAVGRPEPGDLGRFTTCQETEAVFTDMPSTEGRATVTVQLSDGPHIFTVGR